MLLNIYNVASHDCNYNNDGNGNGDCDGTVHL